MKKILSLFMVTILLRTQVAYAKDYSNYPQRFWDVPKEHWAYSYISELSDKNVISGYDDGSFKPNKTVSRAEWAKMMVIASGKQPISLENNKSYALDYSSNDWYYTYINAVINYMNFYNDDGDIYFKPNQAVSREDVTVSLVKLKGYNIEDVDYSYIAKFKDFNSISNNVKKYIAVAIEKELITGFEDNTFRGQDTLTRAEAATLLCRAFQLGNDNKIDSSNSFYFNENNYDNEVNNNPSKNESDDDFENTETIIEDTPSDDGKYELDTILEVNIPNSENSTGPINYITYKGDVIYYYDYDESSINSIDTINLNTKTIYDLTKAIEFNNDKYIIKSVKNLVYDSSTDSLILYAICEHYNDITEERKSQGLFINIFNNEVLYNVSAFLPDMIFNIEHDEFWITNDNYLYNSKPKYDEIPDVYGTKYNINYLDSSQAIDKIDYVFDSVKINNNLYFLTNGGIYKYDYKNLKLLLESSHNPIGVKNESFYIVTSNKVVIKDLNYNTIDNIYFDDIDIIDNKQLINPISVANKIIINSNNEIILYDFKNSSFRIIK